MFGRLEVDEEVQTHGKQLIINHQQLTFNRKEIAVNSRLYFT